jgi:hypothetical protein
MPIDREQLLADILRWLLPQNVLSDEDIMYIAELIIAQVGDDEDNYAEVLCKTLHALANENSARYISSSNIKRERVGRVSEIEYFDRSQNIWVEWIKTLPERCALFGYNMPFVTGIKINPGRRIKSPPGDCGCSFNFRGDL